MKTYKCILTVVPRGRGEDVVDASKIHGAKGGTIIHGRGSSVHETKKIFGSLIEPEKDIVISVVETSLIDAVIEGIKKDLDINSPGKGILFVLDTERVEGILVD